jgi:hypothetical protein
LGGILKKKRIKVQSAKAKGRNLQKLIAEKISKLTGFECGKDKPIESRPMGQSGTDVRLEQSVLKKFPYSVECKAQEKWSIHKWIEQAQENLLPNTDWLLVAKRSYQKPVVILDLDCFFKLLDKKKK